MRINSQCLRLYAVTSRAWAADEAALFRQIEAAVRGGAGAVQLREKDRTVLPEEARRFADLCRQAGALSILNDQAELVPASGADGAHVGQEDLEAGRARALLGPDRILGVSVHTVEEALRAQAAGADYLGAGTIFPTTTKADATPVSLETLRAIVEAVDIPVVAIGGITRDNLPELKGLGLAGVAVVSAIFAQKDPEAAARELLALSGRL